MKNLHISKFFRNFVTNFEDMAAIPQQIIKASESRKHLGGSLQRLCKYKGEEVYSYVYDEEMTIGYPELYLWNGHRARTVSGESGLKLLSELPI